jgi:NitT/TauT family transport system substrate-binding protein
MSLIARPRLFASLVLGGLASAASAENLTIGIGHQSQCTDTYTAGIIVKQLGLLEKYLPHEGKYKDISYTVDWKDYASGPPITNMMLADKLQFGVMGDYPLIVNGASFQQTESERSLYVSGTGYNLRGAGNGMVVPVASSAYSVQDLKGKSVSVPVGSAAWGMLLKALQDANLTDQVDIQNQSPPVGAANIAENKIAAHADFCPWSELLQYRGTGRMIYSGIQSGVPYLHGVVVRRDFAEKYPEIVVAMIKAVVAAGNWVREDPVRAAENLEKWTGVEKEVMYLYFSEGGVLTLDPTIKPQWIDALKRDHEVLAKGKNIPPLDFNQWIDDHYIRTAYKELGLNYEASLKQVVDPKEANASLPSEIWVDGKGIRSYPTLVGMMNAYSELQKTSAKINATYVYDTNTGVKLFGKSAFYVKSKDGALKAFLLKPDAEAFAKAQGAELVDFVQALARVSHVANAKAPPAPISQIIAVAEPQR